MGIPTFYDAKWSEMQFLKQICMKLDITGASMLNKWRGPKAAGLFFRIMNYNYGGHFNRGYNRHGRGSYSGGYHNYRGSGAGCIFCTGVEESVESHSRKQCPLFRQLKSQISGSPYVDVKLRDNDERGFAAAGFLLWKRSREGIDVLMAREFRDGEDKLNFLGGKRLCQQESSIDVALKKVDIESGGKLTRSTLRKMKQPPLVHWSGKFSKFALYLFEVTLWNDCEIDVMSTGIYSEGIKRLEWVSWDDLKSHQFQEHELHDFAIEMVKELSDPCCNVLGRIKELFDMAKAASVKSTDISREKQAFSFDVIKAIMSTAEVARGSRLELSLSWGSIFDAVNVLHHSDIRKLKLRFHPDRLKSQIQREPSDVEKNASTKAMQVLNQILDLIENPKKAPPRSSSSGGVFGTVDELKGLIKQLEGGDESDQMIAAVSSKLAEIRLA